MLATRRSTIRRLPHAAICALLLPSPARAQDRPVAELLREGVSLRAAGRDADALPRFVEAHARAPGGLTAAQRGLVEQALGRWVDAERHLREALADPADAWVARNRAAIERAYAVVREQVGAVEFLGGVAGARVFVDGAEVGTLPLAEPLRARVGAITLEVRAPGHYDVTRRLDVRPGTTREWIEMRAIPEPPEAPVARAVSPPPPPPPLPPPPRGTRASPSRAWMRPAGWSALGVGLAAGVGAAIAAVVYEDAAARYNRECDAPGAGGAGTATCADLLATGDAMRPTAIALGVTAGVLVATGITGIVLARAERREAITAVWTGAGLMVTGRW